MEPINLQEKVDSRSVVLRVFRHWKELLFTTIIGAVFAAILYYLVVEVLPGEPPYTTEATMYLEFEPDTLEAYQYFNAYTWRQIAKSDMVIDLVMPFLPEGYTREELINAIWVELKADVRVMTLQIQSDDQERADVMMNSMILGLGKFGEKRPEFISIYEIGLNNAERIPRNLLTERAAGLGAVCGFLLYLAILFVREIMSNAVFVPEECKPKFGLFTETVFLKNGNPWRENEWKLSSDEVKEGVILATGKKELKQALDLTGANSGYVYDELTKEAMQKLQSAKNVYFTIVWGKTAGTEVGHIISECEKRGIALKSVILTEADARFLNKYYRK